MITTSLPQAPSAAMLSRKLLVLATAIRTHSAAQIKDANLLLAQVLLVCQDAGVKVSDEDQCQLIRQLRVGLRQPRADDPQALTVRMLAQALAGLPPNMPVLYQRVPDRYVEQLGWPTREFLFDRERLLSYLPSYGASVLSDGAGNQALCIDLLPPEAVLQNDEAGPITRDNVYEAPLAAEIETFCRNGIARLHRDLHSRYLSSDDVLDLAYRFKAQCARASAEPVWVIADQIALVCNDVMYLSHSNGGRHLRAGELAQQLSTLQDDLPVYCARLSDDFTCYGLRTRDGMRDYADVYDCQLTTGPDGFEAACLNAFC